MNEIDLQTSDTTTSKGEITTNIAVDSISNPDLEVNTAVVGDVDSLEEETKTPVQPEDKSEMENKVRRVDEVLGYQSENEYLKSGESTASKASKNAVDSQLPMLPSNWWGSAMIPNSAASDLEGQLAALVNSEQEIIRTNSQALSEASAGRILSRESTDKPESRVCGGGSGLAWRRLGGAEAALIQREEKIRILRDEAKQLQHVSNEIC